MLSYGSQKSIYEFVKYSSTFFDTSKNMNMSSKWKNLLNMHLSRVFFCIIFFFTTRPCPRSYAFNLLEFDQIPCLVTVDDGLNQLLPFLHNNLHWDCFRLCKLPKLLVKPFLPTSTTRSLQDIYIFFLKIYKIFFLFSRGKIMFFPKCPPLICGPESKKYHLRLFPVN